MLEGRGRFEKKDASIDPLALAGLRLKYRLNKSLSLDIAGFGGAVTEGLLIDSLLRRSNVLTGIGRLDGSDELRGFWDINGHLRFQSRKLFSAEIGKTRQFIGDGYRSLFLSDNPAPYPYLKLKTKVWHLEYTNLFAWQRGVFDVSKDPDGFENKFTSSHLLSWNVSPRTNIHLFETIIWQGEDSLSQRGFDVYYLNPIIFYRPVEFAAGSADNAIIGFGFSYKLYPSYLIYGQMAFDEFLLEQFRSGDGWWGNKFGVQAGIKGINVAEVEGLFLQAEFNIVRPFTYSHGSPVQNYSHLNEPLAHPLGANFYECLLIGYYDWRNWEIRNQLSYVLKGNDTGDRNLGGDIFRSYVGPYQNFGNFIGQGDQSRYFENHLSLSRVIERGYDTRIQLTYSLLEPLAGTDRSSVHAVSIAIRSNVWDGYR